MSHYEDVDFDFVTCSSGSFEALLERIGMTAENACEMAITYYAYYVQGEYKDGPVLVMLKPDNKSAWPLDDDKTDEHVRADTLTMKVDSDVLRILTRDAHKGDISDTLTSAFILLEKICDVNDTEWNLGLYTKGSRARKGQPAQGDEVVLISMKTQPIAKAAGAAPRPPGLH